MVGSLLLRGMLVGILAGVLAFGFARVFGEPSVERAIAFEEASGGHSHGEAAPAPGQGGATDAHSHGPGAAPHSHTADAHAADAHAPDAHAPGEHAAQTGAAPAEPELFSRATQSGPGLLVALVVYGAAMGGLFALVFAYVNGRLGPLSPRATAALLALAAFIALVLVPGLKYPANPPAVGDGATIGLRTRLFFLMLATSVAALAGAVVLARRLMARHGAWTGALLAALGYGVVLALVGLALPTVNEVPAGFSADLLWQFRLAALGLQAVLWAVIGLGFGAWMELGARPHVRPALGR
ncbi:CbtA family protein [Azorhizobium doebereinerae]|uniref:CbtA family protein n=1 Tax=Azorhizobium doebereinerae TaxID=281091 RepID=UPI000490D50D|nr:CbtA family protein [Azorhizobium doebereinerae]